MLVEKEFPVGLSAGPLMSSEGQDSLPSLIQSGGRCIGRLGS